MLASGVFLSDRYEILEKVGSGGMSDVYKAKCHKLNRFVAIKVLKHEFSSDKSFVSKFSVEAQSAAGLSHPNIVNIYDVGEDDGRYYIVMELVEGITLKNYIEKKGRLEVKEAVSITIQILQGIQAAHNHHIIHRDIKPQNIIISKEGKVKVTDFGIARVSTNQTISSNAMGSVHYISPEQARGGYSDERSDIYSLGISLYEMVTGTLPFQGDTAVAVALQHIQGEISSPKEIVANLPISIEKIIYKCTQKKPERRYLKASDLLIDLKKSLVTPNEDFVQLLPLNTTAPTVMLSNEDVSIIKKEARANLNKDKAEDEDPEEDINPKVEKVMTILGVVAAVLIVGLLVFIVAKMVGILKEPGSNVETQTTISTEETTIGNSVTDTKVPDLSGLTVEDALIELNKASLGIERVYESSNDVEKGYIISQEYEEGDMIPRNTQVKVVISTGPDKFQMIEVVGMSEEEAILALEGYGLKVGAPEYVYHDEVAQGHAISSSPAVGTMVQKNDIITLNISRGREIKEVLVPDLKGKTEAEARTELEVNGLVAGQVSQVFSNEVGAGLVISQSYVDGTTIKQGEVVDFVISKGPEGYLGSVTIDKAQIREFLTYDEKYFKTPVIPGPGAPEAVEYSDAVLKLDLVQTTADGRTITKTIDNIPVTTSSFPLTKSGIQGEPGIMEGIVKVYITIGNVEYSAGNNLIDFQQVVN